jgi:hypothetical protein
MSVYVMSLVWKVTFPTQSQKLIALRLADYSNDEGDNVWPSKSTVARDVGCSESTVKRTLGHFRDVGLLSVIREGGSGPGQSTHYRINVELLKQLHGQSLEITPSPQPSVDDVKGVNLTPIGGHSCDPGWGSSNDPQTTNEPSSVYAASSAAGLDQLEVKLREAAGPCLACPTVAQGLFDLSVPLMWIQAGADVDLDIVPTLRAVGKSRKRGISSWRYFSERIAETVANRKAGLPAVIPAPSKTPASDKQTAAHEFLAAIERLAQQGAAA